MTEKWEPFKKTDSKVAYELGNGYFYYVVQPDQVLADHSHLYAETYWIMEGRGEVIIEGEKKEFDGPSVIEVDANAFHQFIPQTEVRFFEFRHPIAE